MKLSFLFTGLAPIAALATSVTLVLSSSACVLDDSFLVEEQFYCDDSSDCSEARFTCLNNICQIASQVGCTDQDDDGYGVSEVGIEQCRFEDGIDPDDTDASIYPGAPELCDGKNNDPDANEDIDEPIACENAGDCTERALNNNVRPSCNDNGQCVFVAFNLNVEGCDLEVTCKNGSYDEDYQRLASIVDEDGNTLCF